MSETRRVYSTAGDNQCPRCGKALRKCRCETPQQADAEGDGIARIRRERKGRGGKEVTVIEGLPLQGGALKALAKSLKTACGSGGSVQGRCIEIQGDHRERVAALLREAGHDCKLAGG